MHVHVVYACMCGMYICVCVSWCVRVYVHICVVCIFMHACVCFCVVCVSVYMCGGFMRYV